jgi:hypothetical protein
MTFLATPLCRDWREIITPTSTPMIDAMPTLPPPTRTTQILYLPPADTFSVSVRSNIASHLASVKGEPMKRIVSGSWCRPR